ncbi:MAG: phosphotransferase enzyme family protein [Acidimicrobiia bacterium]
MSDGGFPRAVLQAAFDVGDWHEVQLLPAGKSRHHLLTTAAGRFVLRCSYRSKTSEAVRFEHELVAYLRARGFPGPEFVPTVDGEPCAQVDGRLWRLARFVPGHPASAGIPGQTEAVAEALARYHRLVAGFSAGVSIPEAPPMPAALAERLAAVPTEERFLAAVPEELAGPLRFALAEGRAVHRRLVELYRVLPVTIIHAGCRRGSALFDGGHLRVVLDFDSARLEARAMDVAVAVHDFAKVYGDPASPAYKVHLDRAVVARFVGAYQSASALTPEELEAVPLLLRAKRLKRALGRYARLLGGDPLSPNDLRKIVLELARVRSLGEGEDLVSCMS